MEGPNSVDICMWLSLAHTAAMQAPAVLMGNSWLGLALPATGGASSSRAADAAGCQLLMHAVFLFAAPYHSFFAAPYKVPFCGGVDSLASASRGNVRLRGLYMRFALVVLGQQLQALAFLHVHHFTHPADVAHRR